ncbi:hypothetical protein AAG570_004178 [Ranatra chinensis]|uniref:Cytochrome P450 n=1 Tax=Ranatra chinensis TaxID=642074 RepID=A0ABD0Y5B0_9HEMI
MLDICFGLIVIAFFAYRYLIRTYGFWKSHGFPYLEGRFPFGTEKESSTQGRYLGYVFDDLYKKLDPYPYGGFYTMRRPMLLLRDPEIIKHVLVKDFEYFRDRTRIVENDREPLTQHLVALNGDRWHGLRIKMTPAFTSGKLKNMFPLFGKCSRQLEEVLEWLADAREVFDVKDLAASFTADIIASCAFGLEVNSLKNRDDEFRKMGADAFPRFTRRKILLYNMMNNFIPGLNRNRFSKRTQDFMMKMVSETVEYRENNNFKRNDFLDLLIDMKNKDQKLQNSKRPSEGTNMTMDLLVAQCFIFILAGLETSSSVITFCLYELALNAGVQEKLRLEIQEAEKRHGGLTYQAVQEMTYLDQVVSETTRKYPTLIFLQRTCTKPYRMPKGGQLVEEGIEVIIPTYSLHYDPKYFPEPEKFDPDRFSPERKSSIPQFAYLPFGEGPRICIGMRFGLLQVKMGICTFLSKFEILQTPETPVPLTMGSFPFGTEKEVSTEGRFLGHVFDDLYKKLDPHPYGGIYIMRRPHLLVRDPDIIKHVLVKDFQHFRDRSRLMECEKEPLTHHLFALTGDRWRALRTKMTPTFTSGKLKNMFPLFEKCSLQLETVLRRLAEGGEVFDVKDLMANFTTDVIASCAFGLEANSILNKDNEFRKMGADTFPNRVKTKQLLHAAINNFIPGFNRFFDFNNRFSKETHDNMMRIVGESVEYREKNGFRRNDFLDLVIAMKNEDAKKGTEQTNESPIPEMTMDLLAAQCFVFLVAGLETSSSVATFCLYELALNPDIQERLRQEVEEVREKHGGLSYQAVQEMKYLDQVVSETMRKYPTLHYLQRTCTKPYTMPDSGLLLDEGTELIIPTYSLHHDPRFFPDPEKFDPDRFSSDRESGIPHCAYLPFGEGPRICIGMRFGLLQTKMGICTFLPKFKIVATPETPVPLRMARTAFVTQVKDPIKVQIKRLA